MSNNVAKQAVKDGCDAYKRFFKGLADKPRFKSRRKSKKSFYNDNNTQSDGYSNIYIII